MLTIVLCLVGIASGVLLAFLAYMYLHGRRGGFTLYAASSIMAMLCTIHLARIAGGQ